MTFLRPSYDSYHMCFYIIQTVFEKLYSMTDTLYSRNDQREYSVDLFQLYYLIYIPGVQGIFQTSGSSKLRLRPIPVTIEKVSSGIEKCRSKNT